MKPTAVALVVLIGALYVADRLLDGRLGLSGGPRAGTTVDLPDSGTLGRPDSGTMVQAGGRVQRTLSDDQEGSRHQRFIVELPSGQTVLIAHNIDLAPRVPVVAGDEVRFSGEYEWNERGGVVHWTHRDPQRRHAHGWIEHGGKVYQ